MIKSYIYHLPDWAWQTRGLPPSPVHASFPFSVPAHTLFKGPCLSFSHILVQIFLFKLDKIEHNLISYLSLCELEPIPNTRFLLVESLFQSYVALSGRHNWYVNLSRCFVKFRYGSPLCKSLSYFPRWGNLVLDELERSRELIFAPSCRPAPTDRRIGKGRRYWYYAPDERIENFIDQHDVSMVKPCSSAITEDIIELLLARREASRRHIRVLEVWERKNRSIIVHIYEGTIKYNDINGF